MEFQFYYQVLGIPETAGIEQLKKAYREKVKLYHPDVSILPDAQELFISLTEAYEVLLRKLTREKETSTYTRPPAMSPEQEEIQKEYYRQQMEWIRQMAYAQSRMKFEEFKKTPTYRTTQALNKIADYLIFCFGFIMIAGAIVGIREQYLRDDILPANVAGVIFVVIVGSIIIAYSSSKIFKK